MQETDQAQQADLISLATDLVSAYVSNNSLPVSELPGLLASIHAVLSEITTGPAQAEAASPVERPTPAQIRKSITPAHLISFEDGKPYKTLRRHLTLRGLTPEAYRTKWGLPADYPMTSANYSAQRSELARSLGLGQPRRKTVESSEAVEPSEAAGTAEPEAAATDEAKPARRGRRKTTS